MALAVGPFLTVRAYDDDRERVLRAALESPTADAERTVDDPLRLQLLGALFAVTAQRRRPADLPAVAAESLAVARRIDDPDAEQRALSQSAWAAMALHRFDEALDGFARTAALAERRGDVQGRALAEARRGVVLRNVGRAAEGDPLLQAMVTLSRRDGPRRDCSIWLVTRAEGLVDLGRADEAEELLDEALAIALDLRDEVGEAHCRLALARVHAARGALGAADEELASARRQLDPRADDEADLEVLRLELDLAVHRGAWGRAARSRAASWPAGVGPTCRSTSPPTSPGSPRWPPPLRGRPARPTPATPTRSPPGARSARSSTTCASARRPCACRARPTRTRRSLLADR